MERPQEDDEEDEKLLEELEDKQLLAREKCFKTFFLLHHSYSDEMIWSVCPNS